MNPRPRHYEGSGLPATAGQLTPVPAKHGHTSDNSGHLEPERTGALLPTLLPAPGRQQEAAACWLMESLQRADDEAKKLPAWAVAISRAHDRQYGSTPEAAA